MRQFQNDDLFAQQRYIKTIASVNQRDAPVVEDIIQGYALVQNNDVLVDQGLIYGSGKVYQANVCPILNRVDARGGIENDQLLVGQEEIKAGAGVSDGDRGGPGYSVSAIPNCINFIIRKEAIKDYKLIYITIPSIRSYSRITWASISTDS